MHSIPEKNTLCLQNCPCLLCILYALFIKLQKRVSSIYISIVITSGLYFGVFWVTFKMVFAIMSFRRSVIRSGITIPFISSDHDLKSAKLQRSCIHKVPFT